MEKLTRYEIMTSRAKAGGLVCANCKSNDELYSDSHGTFCRRCGPSYPLWQAGSMSYGRAALAKEQR